MAAARIAITAGEPAGIGPDVTLAAAMRPWPAELLAIGDFDLLSERAKKLGLPITLHQYRPGERPVPHQPGRLGVLPVPLAAPAVAGQLDVRNAPYVIETLRQAVSGCLQQQFQAVVTAPVQKSVINQAGQRFSGHTEFFAEATSTPKVVMLLVAGELRVALATTHLPLASVPAAITEQSLADTLRILDSGLRGHFRLSQPRIAVLGLNPHAGEDGHLGREEIDTIIPAIQRLRDQGMRLTGPLPADTAFNPVNLKSCDAVLAMYHDQGLPVLKYASFGNAVNVTLGLPIIRTSVDHGTALPLAGTGKAQSGSMEATILTAISLASS